MTAQSGRCGFERPQRGIANKFERIEPKDETTAKAGNSVKPCQQMSTNVEQLQNVAQQIRQTPSKTVEHHEHVSNTVKQCQKYQK